MNTADKKILALQKKVAKQTEKTILEIQAICEKLDYKNSSLFSYNIDRIKHFNDELQQFETIKQTVKNDDCGGIKATIYELCKPNGITIGG